MLCVIFCLVNKYNYTLQVLFTAR